ERRYRLAAQAGIVEVQWDGEGQSNFSKIFEDVKPASSKAQELAAGARAYNDGYNSALVGGAIGDSPFQSKPGSVQYVEWRNGWSEGRERRLLRHPEEAQREKEAETADDIMPSISDEAAAPPA